MHTEYYIEVSAVCTHPEYRRKGFGGGLTCALSQMIQERGKIPFLQVAEENNGAIRIYEEIGFRKCIHGYYDVLERTIL